MAKSTVILTAEDRTWAAFKSLLANFKEIETGMGKLKSVAGVLKTALEVVGVGLSVNYFKDMIKESIDALDHLNDLSKTTRISVETLSGLQLAAKQTGSDLEGTAASINKLAVNMGKHAEAFKELGITASDPLEAFKQLADILNAIPDQQTRAAVAASALGKSWQSAAPLLAEGGKRIGEMVEKGRQLSGVTKEAAESADHFNDMLAEFEAATAGFKKQTAIALLPSLNQIITKMADAAREGGLLMGILTGIGQAGKIALFGVDDTAIQKQTKYVAELRKEIEKLEKNIPIQEKAGPLGRLSGGDPDKMKQDLAGLRLNLDWATRSLKNMEEQAKKTQEALQQITPGLDEKTKKFLKQRPEFEKQSYEGFEGGRFIKTGMGGEAAVGGPDDPRSAYEIALSYKKQRVEVAKATEAEELVIMQDASEAQRQIQQERADDARKIWENFLENVQRTLGSQLYEVMQGNFKNIGLAFAQMLQHMIADALAANITKAMFGGGSGLIGWLSSFGGGGQASAAASDAGYLPSAKGSWFDGGMAHFAMGGIVNSPTRFSYGGGFRNGLMGEAGPEAIMPLARDSSGRLGVRGGSGGITQVNNIHIDSRTDRAEVVQLVTKAVRQGNAELTEQLQRSGAI